MIANGTMSAPMGDAAQKSTAGAVIVDSYSRAYVLNLARTLRQPRLEQPMQQAIGGESFREAATSSGPVAVSITVRRDILGRSAVQSEQLRLNEEVGREAKAVAGLAVARLSSATALAYGFSYSGRALQKRLNGHSDGAFLVAQDPMLRTGFYGTGVQSVAARHDLGPVALSFTAESGRTFDPFVPRLDEAFRYRRMSFALDARRGPARFSVGASRLTESATVLGARFSDLLSAQGSSTNFLDAELSVRLGRRWDAGAALRRGWTRIPHGCFSDGGRLVTNAWSFDLSRTTVLGSGDLLALRISQPLRASHGALQLHLPTGYDFGTGQAHYQRQAMNLAPSGREIDYELSYGHRMFGGYLDLHAFVRSDPGHFAHSGRDLGAALRFTAH